MWKSVGRSRPDRRRGCERSFSSTLWACSHHRRTTGPVFGWLPWQPPPPRLLHVNKENIGVRADCRSYFRWYIFFLFPFSFVLFLLFLFCFCFIYLFSFSLLILILILSGNDDSFSRGIFPFSCIVVEVWSRIVEIRRERGREFFTMKNERKKDKKVCRVVRFFTWCVSSCVAWTHAWI